MHWQEPCVQQLLHPRLREIHGEVCSAKNWVWLRTPPFYCLNSRTQTQGQTSSCATPRSWRTAICPRSRASASRTSTATPSSPLMWWVLPLPLSTWTFKASMLNIFNQRRPLLFNKPLHHRTMLCRNNSVTHARTHTQASFVFRRIPCERSSSSRPNPWRLQRLDVQSGVNTASPLSSNRPFIPNVLDSNYTVGLPKAGRASLANAACTNM